MFSLLAAVFLMVLLTYLPGFLSLRVMGCSQLSSIGFAPVVSTLAYILWGIILFNMGVFATWQLMVAPIITIPAIAYAVFKVRLLKGKPSIFGHARLEPEDVGGNAASIGFFSGFHQLPCRIFNHLVDGRLLAVGLVVNVSIALVVFVGTMSGPDSFSQNFDMGHHLSHVAAVVEHGNWSTLNVSIDGTESGGFYPSVLHTYAALITACLGLSSACSINAVLFVLISLVFPVGVYLLATVVLPARRIAPLCVCMLALVFPGFPWVLIRYSALLANVAGFALMPLALVLFIVALESGVKRCDRALRALLCVAAMAVISLAHPNTLFSAGVFLIPFCAWRIWDACGSSRSMRMRSGICKWSAVLAFLVFCAFAWKTVHGLSAFQGVVEYYYGAKLTLPEAIRGILLMEFRWFSPNIPLAALTVVGLVAALRAKGCRWLVVTYLLAAVQLVVCGSQDPSYLKSLLCGFWYNHDFRLMASFAICAMPLTGLGMTIVVSFFEGLIVKRRGASSREQGFFSRAFGVSEAAVAVIALVMTLACFPFGYSPSEGVVTRSLGESMAKLVSIYDWDGDYTIYHSEEREFVQEAVEALPDDALVMNLPYDGSAYAYGLDGLNTYFKTNAAASEEGSAEYIVETRLCDIAWDPEVRAAAKELGITHVIQLDHGFGKGSSTLEREYSKDDWAGVSSIDDSTEGFKEILASGDMRLDEIR